MDLNSCKQTPSEVLISGDTVFHKVISPVIILSFALILIGASLFAGDQIAWIQRFFMAGAGLGISVFSLALFATIHFQLKDVWISDRGLRVSSFRRETVVPYTAVESITETILRLHWDPGFVIVRLNEATPFGLQFTFVPKNAEIVWGWPAVAAEDDTVRLLRARVAAALGPKNRLNFADLERSIMADDELDRPFQET